MSRLLLLIIGMLAVAGIPLAAWADERPRPSAPQEVTVRLSEYKFEPAQVEVRSGKPVELRLVNDGKVLHEFVTDAALESGADIETNGVVAVVRGFEEMEVPPGATVVLRFTPKKTGRFPFRCDAEDPVSHHENGMKGVLIVR